MDPFKDPLRDPFKEPLRDPFKEPLEIPNGSPEAAWSSSKAGIQLLALR